MIINSTVKGYAKRNNTQRNPMGACFHCTQFVFIEHGIPMVFFAIQYDAMPQHISAVMIVTCLEIASLLQFPVCHQ